MHHAIPRHGRRAATGLAIPALALPAAAASARPFASPTAGRPARVAGHRLAEDWMVRDDLTALRRLGARIEPAGS
jgi:hypothetical protein